jgi:hypothetical protein
MAIGIKRRHEPPRIRLDRAEAIEGPADRHEMRAFRLEGNPTITQAFIDRQIERDAEVGAVSRDVVEAAILPGRHELPPAAGINYTAFVDPSGGSSDSMTLAIAHRDKDGRAPHSAQRAGLDRPPAGSPRRGRECGRRRIGDVSDSDGGGGHG